jgi:alpha-glucosidase (family GH31 glycosyl hydrolase)
LANLVLSDGYAFTEQVIESQQNAKQSRNEAEKLRDMVRNLQMDLESKKNQTGTVVQDDNRRQEELLQYRQECESLQSWISVMETEMKT